MDGTALLSVDEAWADAQHGVRMMTAKRQMAFKDCMESPWRVQFAAKGQLTRVVGGGAIAWADDARREGAFW